MAKNEFASLRAEYAQRWKNMAYDPTRVAAINAAAQRLYRNINRYRSIEATTGVPASWIAVAHERESGAKFDTYLGNGQSLNRVTTIVPKGRGPFRTWEDGAEDALRLKGLEKITDWSIERALYELERYNGFGYRGKEPSPYLWAGTNQSDETGKYVVDGRYDPNAPERQLGVAPLLKALWEIDPTLALPRKKALPPAEVTAPSGSAIAVGTGMLQSGLPLWQAALAAVGVAIVAFVVVKFWKR